MISALKDINNEEIYEMKNNILKKKKLLKPQSPSTNNKI